MSRSSDLIKFAREEEQVHIELKLWKKKLQGILQEIDDAEEMQIAEMAVRSRSNDQRDLAYDMDDILDEFAYQVMRRKLTAAEADKPGTSKLSKFVPPRCTSFDPTRFVRLVNMRPKNGEITSRLQDNHAREGGFGLGKVSGVSTWQRSPSAIPAAYVPWVFGRDEDKGVILDLLHEFGPFENNIGIISIVGMGGVGKKMLAYIRKRAQSFALKVRLN